MPTRRLEKFGLGFELLIEPRLRRDAAEPGMADTREQFLDRGMTAQRAQDVQTSHAHSDDGGELLTGQRNRQAIAYAEALADLVLVCASLSARIDRLEAR